MRRVSIADIVQFTGLSRATVDRVINGRGRVHPRTREVVEDALKTLRAPHPAVAAPGIAADLVLRVGRGMTTQIRTAWDKARVNGTFHDMHQADESAVMETVAGLCSDASRPLIITAKNTERLCDLLREARSAGKRIITLVSDLAADARDCFAGIDNRSAGQTAAFLIGRTLGDRPTSAAVVVGDIAFRCHEDREIGFRTGLRAHFPRVVLSGEARGEDNPATTREAVLQLLREQPALGAIYNVGAGNTGLVEAIREAGRDKDMLVVCHEANRITGPLLREGRIDFAIAADPALQLNDALRVAAAGKQENIRDSSLQDFAVFTRFNLPAYSHIP